MLSSCNAVGVMPISKWMYPPLRMSQRRNSVRVVLLIAQGWRGTSLPWVSIRKEIQRHRCWAFSMKARLQWNLLWRINQKKRNTYGVVPHKPCITPGFPALSFGNPGLSKTQHLRRWYVQSITWITLCCARKYSELIKKSATPMVLKHSFHNTIDTNVRINKRPNVPIFQWIHPLWWMLSSRNAVGIAPLFQWMNFAI